MQSLESMRKVFINLLLQENLLPDINVRGDQSLLVLNFISNVFYSE